MHRKRVQIILQLDLHLKKQNVRLVILGLAIVIAIKKSWKKICSNNQINVV
jgi:hypothetical protein